MCRFGKKANGRMAHSAGPTSLSILLPASDTYKCPGGKALQQYRRPFKNQRTGVTRQYEDLPGEPARLRRMRAQGELLPWSTSTQNPRSIHEAARDVVRRLAGTPEYLQSRRERKKIERLFAHLKRILKLNRLRLRGPCGARDEFLLAAIAQNLRKLAKLVNLPPLDGGSQAIA